MAYGIVTVRRQTEVFYIPADPRCAMARACLPEWTAAWAGGQRRGPGVRIPTASNSWRRRSFFVVCGPSNPPVRVGRKKAPTRPMICSPARRVFFSQGPRLFGKAFPQAVEPQPRQATKDDGPPHGTIE